MRVKGDVCEAVNLILHKKRKPKQVKRPKMSEHYMKAQIALQSGGACAQLCACLVSLSCCAGLITFMVYLGKYAFDN